jgi:hypothetical protein
VKIQPQLVVTPEKQTNKQVRLELVKIMKVCFTSRYLKNRTSWKANRRDNQKCRQSVDKIPVSSEVLVNAAYELKLQHDAVWVRVLNAERADEHATLECLLPQTVGTVTIGLTCTRVKGLLFESGA